MGDVHSIDEAMQVDVDAPAIVITMTQSVGPDRNMQLQFAVPLGMTPMKLNSYIDKVTSVIDRQNDIGVLKKAKLYLEQAERDLKTNTENQANYLLDAEAKWYASGRKGAFALNGTQQAQLRNFKETEVKAKTEIIPKLRENIAELERKIAEGA